MIGQLGPYLLGPNDTEENGIYCGDARELAKQIPDESIELIVTDPLYDQMDDYRWLAEMGARVLKPGGNLVIQAAHYYLPRIFSSIGDHLEYVWMLAEKLSGGQAAIFKHKLTVGWKPYIWYSKGRRNGSWVFDWFEGGGITKQFHKWGDSPQMFLQLIDRLSGDGIIFDPFTGGGTIPAVCKMLDRRYLAFEIALDVAQTARDRVRNTQPPLLFEQAKQQEMFIDAD